ncbi:hypothetical protein [Salinibaculum salinum]|uniref:hypothetical protein n=1 Tax=Salinibaculum salinum TaxID=3131996 RepID=UPI0030ED255A
MVFEISKPILLEKPQWWIPICLGLCLGLFFVSPIILGVAVVALIIIGWAALVSYDCVCALSVFIALLPLWVFLKWIEWPAISLAGTTIHVATLFKEVLMIVFFFHWLISATRSDKFAIRLTPSLIGFFAIAVIGLLQAGLRDYPISLRPYIEVFLLVGIPLLSIDLSKREINRLLICFAIGGGITALVASYHVFFDPQFLLDPAWIREDIFKTKSGLSAFDGSRLQSFTGNPNNLAMIMLFTSIISFSFTFRGSIREQVPRRLVYAGLFTISAILLMLTRSRDDIVFLAIAILLLIVIKRQTVPLILGGLVFLTGFLTNFDQIVLVLNRLIEQGNPRFNTWVSGVQFYGLELLSGVGTIQTQFAQTHPIDSSYFRMLIQIGIGGLFLFIFMNLRVLHGLSGSIEYTKINTESILFILLVIMLGGFSVRVTLFVFPFSFYYWTFIALSLQCMSHQLNNGTTR